MINAIVIKAGSALPVKKLLVLMIALKMEFALKENVIVKKVSLVIRVLLNHAPMNVMEKELAKVVNAVVILDGLEKIVEQELARMLAQVMELVILLIILVNVLMDSSELIVQLKNVKMTARNMDFVSMDNVTVTLTSLA